MLDKSGMRGHGIVVGEGRSGSSGKWGGSCFFPLFEEVIHVILAVRPRRRLREDRRSRPPKLREDVVQLDGGAPEVEVGMGEIDEPVQDCPRVVEQGWLRIGLEVLGESSLFFFVLVVYKYGFFQAGLPSLRP